KTGFKMRLRPGPGFDGGVAVGGRILSRQRGIERVGVAFRPENLVFLEVDELVQQRRQGRDGNVGGGKGRPLLLLQARKRAGARPRPCARRRGKRAGGGKERG